MARPASSGRYRRRAGWPDGTQIRPVSTLYAGICPGDTCVRCGCLARYHLIGLRRGRPVGWECESCLVECDYVSPRLVPAAPTTPRTVA